MESSAAEKNAVSEMHEGRKDQLNQANEQLAQQKQQLATERTNREMADMSHAVAAERVTASGFGSTRAVADNSSPEGRANNRRVEIVVGAKQLY